MAIRIFIDQGHNPVNPNAGAEGNGYREQDLVYYIGKELEALLNANPNFEARTSRNSPDEIYCRSPPLALPPRQHPDLEVLLESASGSVAEIRR